ncbi:MAG TPA: hypothetical protein VGR90_07845 [Acidimicrobiales bacterium]|nr:hypothetical protein [Acidimicrobiales bacterium]
MITLALLLAIGALFAYWTIRGGDTVVRRNTVRPEPVRARARFIPLGTTRVVTLPGSGFANLQVRRIRLAVAEHRARGWELVHDPLPPVMAPEWTLTFRKVR